MPPRHRQTAVNTFEGDVTAITPINSMNESLSPKTDFIPMNSFENDVIGITPVAVDNSQLDNL